MVVGDERIGWARRTEAKEGGAAGLKRCTLGEPYLFVLDIVCRRGGGELRRERCERCVQRLVARKANVVERIDQDRIEETAIRGVIGARAASVPGNSICSGLTPR